MRGHVIRSLRGVSILRDLLGNQPIKEVAQVKCHIRIGILLNHQRGRSVLDKHSEQSVGDALLLEPSRPRPA